MSRIEKDCRGWGRYAGSDIWHSVSADIEMQPFTGWPQQAKVMCGGPDLDVTKGDVFDWTDYPAGTDNRCEECEGRRVRAWAEWLIMDESSSFADGSGVCNADQS